MIIPIYIWYILPTLCIIVIIIIYLKGLVEEMREENKGFRYKYSNEFLKLEALTNRLSKQVFENLSHIEDLEIRLKDVIKKQNDHAHSFIKFMGGVGE